MTVTRAPAPTEQQSRRGGPPAILVALPRYGLQVFLLVVVAVLAVVDPDIGSLSNVQSILLQSSFTGLAAAGMTLLIIGGTFDLSVAGIVALCGVVTATLLERTSPVVAVLVALVIGAGLGLVNGLVVTRCRFPAFIATYGLMNVYLAVAFIITGGQVVAVSQAGFLSLATGTFALVPMMFWLLVLVAAVCHVLLHRTRFGRDLRAIGSNERAGVLAGLRVDRTRTLAFCLVGVCTAAAALGLTSLLSSANASMSLGFELNVIAVAVVGGTSLEGGRGTLVGTVTAAVLFSALSNALNLLGVESYWQYVATGLVLVLALGVAGLRRRMDGSDA